MQLYAETTELQSIAARIRSSSPSLRPSVSDNIPSGSIKKSGSQDEDKMAKLLRERSTAQKRRQVKREELTKLSSTIQEYETRLAKLRLHVDTLPEVIKPQVVALYSQAGAAPIGCRLCSILDQREESYSSVERLVQHLRMHHASDIRNRGDDEELIRFGTVIPSEDAELSSDEENQSEDDMPQAELNASSDQSTDHLLEAKRKIRLKRNAASARKSRKRKRVQLERWRMMLPMLKFQVEALESALQMINRLDQRNLLNGTHMMNVPHRFDAEPDVISAAFALIGCSLASSNG